MNTDRPLTLEDLLCLFAVLLIAGLAYFLFRPKPKPWARYDTPVPKPDAPRPVRLVDDGVPWYLKFLYARGKFSPRLLAMWLDGVYLVRVVEHSLSAKAYMVGATLVPPPDNNALIIALLGAFITLSGFGTIQTAVLGDLAPAPGAGNAGATASPPEEKP